jgi:hypothetical protein
MLTVRGGHTISHELRRKTKESVTQRHREDSENRRRVSPPLAVLLRVSV